jgi:beta-glucanase (GH16 family)
VKKRNALVVPFLAATLLSVILAVILFRVATAASPTAISINFTGGGSSMAATETAGVVAKPNWNNAVGASRSSPLALSDENGTPTTASVTWRADSVGSTTILDQAGSNRLMKGYLDNGLARPTVVTVSGLAAGQYIVYVYADGNNGTAARSGSYAISGAGFTTTTIRLTDAANRNFNGTFVQANGSNGNYVTVTINGTGFTLTATPGTASDGRRRAPVNGIQIIPASGGAGGSGFGISGTITPSAGGAGATVNLGGAATATTTADSGGSFSFTGLANGTYSVMPTNAGYAFTPSSRVVTVSGASLTGVNFTASVAATTYSVSGNISPVAGGAGATVTLSGGGGGSVTADSQGNFTFSGLASGTYTLTPSNPGYSFTPYSLTVTVSGANVTGLAFSAAPSGTTVFFDDFSGTSVDSNMWTVADGPGDASNRELECYQPGNVAVSGDALQITTQVQPIACGGTTYSYTSGAVQWTSLSFTYGTVEFRAKMAGGQGPWPAIWLLGTNCQTPSSPCNWPQAGSDEIDITEILGSNHTVVNQQIHSGGNNAGCHPATTDVSQNWHTYQLVWAPGSLVWRIDGVNTCRLVSGVPSTPMFLIIDTAVGGAGGGAVNDATLPQTMMVDYVKVTK